MATGPSWGEGTVVAALWVEMGTQAQGRRVHGDAGTWGHRDEGTREASSSWKAIEGILS